MGDSLDRDILVANRAGYRFVVRVRHGHEESDPAGVPAPDAVLEDMRGLAELLDNERTWAPACLATSADSRNG